MKVFIILLLLCFFSCVKISENKEVLKKTKSIVKNNEDFFCDTLTNSRSVFPMMKNIDSIYNHNTQKFKKHKIHINNYKNYNKILNDYASKILFSYGDIEDEFSIIMRNDSLILENNKNKITLAIFRYKYDFLLKSLNKTDTLKRSFFNYLDYIVKLDTITYDRNCSDSIYKFIYDYNPPYGVNKKLLRSNILKKIEISKKRGILKVIYENKNKNEVWEGKYWGTNSPAPASL